MSAETLYTWGEGAPGEVMPEAAPRLLEAVPDLPPDTQAATEETPMAADDIAELEKRRLALCARLAARTAASKLPTNAKALHEWGINPRMLV